MVHRFISSVTLLIQALSALLEPSLHKRWRCTISAVIILAACQIRLLTEDSSAYSLRICFYISSILGSLLVAGAFDAMPSWLKRLQPDSSAKGGMEVEPLAGPKFFFMTSRHHRLRPNQYFFQYPVLYVGMPTNFINTIGSLFSVAQTELEESNQKRGSWFTFFSLNPRKHMDSRYSFEEKVQRILKRNNINPTIYPHSFIITSPQFLGYSFNPVTFYLVYDHKYTLSYTILEVRNTFGESHVYLLPMSRTTDKATFTCQFPKEFHISPFNNRSGLYGFKILDPIATGKIDITIANFNENNQKLLTVRTFSSGRALDLANASFIETIRLILLWGGNAFMALPRTFMECQRIFKTQNAPMYRRPEPLGESKARCATMIERRCENIFISALRHQVESSSLPIQITLTLPRKDVGEAAELLHFESNASKRVAAGKTVDIRIATPAFYRKYITKRNLLHFYQEEILPYPEDGHTIIVSDWDLLIKVVDNNLVSATSPSSANGISMCPISRLADIWHQRIFDFNYYHITLILIKLSAAFKRLIGAIIMFLLCVGIDIRMAFVMLSYL